MNIEFIQAKDLLKIGFSSLHHARYIATKIRKSAGRKQITYIDVANFLYMNEDYVLRCIVNGKKQ